MVKLSGYIHGLMLEHDCVSIPGFGGMVAQRFRAEINPGTNILRPPSKRISYHKDLVANSHLLVERLAADEKIATHKASQRIAEIVAGWNEELAKGNSIKLEGVGRFYLDKDGFVCFNQSIESNFDLDAFGLEIFRATAIKRSEDIQEAVTVAISESVKSAERRFPIWRAAAVFAGIGALLTVAFFKSDVSIQDSLKANFNPLHYSTSIETKAQAEPVLTDLSEETVATEPSTDEAIVSYESVELEKPAAKVEITKPEVKSPTKLKPFQVVVGSFTEISNAHELVRDLENKGYSPSIINDGSSFSKVSIEGFSTRQEAVQSMRAYKLSVNKGAWIYKR